MLAPHPSLHALFLGMPQALTDSRGSFRSSIGRTQVHGPARLELRGFDGDKATQPYHGTPDLAVCFHALAHYEYWNSAYGLALAPGAVGENITLAGADDSTLCIGDVFAIGTARVQVSAPRAPCKTQARHVGRPDWVKLTIKELRTGLYARVLNPGSLQAGDALRLEKRPNPGLTITELNRCWYHSLDPAIARQYMDAEGLMPWWKQRLGDMLAKRGEGQ